MIMVLLDVTPCNTRDKHWSPSKKLVPVYKTTHHPSPTRQSPSQNITSNKTNLFVQCIHQHISAIICHLTKHFIHFYRVREGTIRYHFVFKVFVVRTDFYTTVSFDVPYLVAWESPQDIKINVIGDITISTREVERSLLGGKKVVGSVRYYPALLTKIDKQWTVRQEDKH
jgi:hypothetical protein